VWQLLQVAPVFAIHGVPQTPTSGERFDGPGNSTTRSELAALFAVIGTPSWRCIESVANPAWRRYLRKVTGRSAQQLELLVGRMAARQCFALCIWSALPCTASAYVQAHATANLSA
jgi:hypothetical protein